MLRIGVTMMAVVVMVPRRCRRLFELPEISSACGVFKSQPPSLGSRTRHRDKGGLGTCRGGGSSATCNDAKSVDRVYRNKTERRSLRSHPVFKTATRWKRLFVVLRDKAGDKNVSRLVDYTRRHGETDYSPAY